MGFLAKLAHIITIYMMGYETNNAINHNNHDNQIIVKSDEVFAEKLIMISKV